MRRDHALFAGVTGDQQRRTPARSETNLEAAQERQLACGTNPLPLQAAVHDCEEQSPPTVPAPTADDRGPTARSRAAADQGLEHLLRPTRRRRGHHPTGAAVTDLHHARYRGLAKTHLEHVYSAVALNLIRLDTWWNGHPLDRTRTSHLARLELRLAA